MSGMILCFALFLGAMVVCLITGRSFLWALGLGLVHSQDIYAFSRLQEQQPDNALWQPREVAANALPAQFGYVPSPQGLNRSDSLNGR